MVDAAQCVLSEFLGAETARCTALEPIHGGKSAASLYQFGHGGQMYVLRLLAPMSSRSRHHHEVSLTCAAGATGVGPCVHFVAADESAIVYDYTPGQILSLTDMRETPVMERLAQRLSRLHSASCLVNTPPDVSLAQLEQDLARDERPGHELFSLPHRERPAWPMWKWGLIALKMGLSHLP